MVFRVQVQSGELECEICLIHSQLQLQSSDFQNQRFWLVSRRYLPAPCFTCSLAISWAEVPAPTTSTRLPAFSLALLNLDVWYISPLNLSCSTATTSSDASWRRMGCNKPSQGSPEYAVSLQLPTRIRHGPDGTLFLWHSVQSDEHEPSTHSTEDLFRPEEPRMKSIR